MAELDLERLRDAVLEGRSGAPQPAARRRQVFVDPNGHVVVGDGTEEGERRMLSEVHLAVFA
jgi:hypothetical protein